MARALVNAPKVLLLDEPLGALDLKLREQMQDELKSLQRQLGISFVFVTHDQGEALSMADRVAIFNQGRIVQVGTPEDIYERPRTRFVADFVGSSNVVPPSFSKSQGLPEKWASLRPEKIIVLGMKEKLSPGYGSVTGAISSIHYQGAATRLHVKLADSTSLSVIAQGNSHAAGATLRLAWPKQALHLLDDTP